MVQRFTSACDARARTLSSSSCPPSSSSASSSGAAAAESFDSSFDNLDLLFGGESAGLNCEAENQNDKGFKVTDSEAIFDSEGEKDRMKVYFPELCLGDALQVLFGVFLREMWSLALYSKRHVLTSNPGFRRGHACKRMH
jgi:hypothetical protein